MPHPSVIPSICSSCLLKETWFQIGVFGQQELTLHRQEMCIQDTGAPCCHVAAIVQALFSTMSIQGWAQQEVTMPSVHQPIEDAH